VKVRLCALLCYIRNSVAVVECHHASPTCVAHHSSTNMIMFMELRVKLKNSRKACSRVTFQRQTSHRLARDGNHVSVIRLATDLLAYGKLFPSLKLS